MMARRCGRNGFYLRRGRSFSKWFTMQAGHSLALREAPWEFWGYRWVPNGEKREGYRDVGCFLRCRKIEKYLGP